MGSIGPAEILVVLVVALLVLGPARLPEAARTVGKAVSEIRKATSGLQTEVRDAFSDAPPVFPTPRTDEPAGAEVPAPIADVPVPPADLAGSHDDTVDLGQSVPAPGDGTPVEQREG